MNGNTPYAGASGVLDAGQVPDPPELSDEQVSALRDSVTDIAVRTRAYLPDEYVVGSELTRGANGARVTVAVRPPAGNPVSAGFEPDFDEEDAALIDTDERDEVARGLAASAALQVKQALGDDFTPTAR